MKQAYLVVFERAAEDNWGAWIPDIPGALGAGDSLDEARISVLAGAGFQLEFAKEMKQPLPLPISKVVDLSDLESDPESAHYEIEWLTIDLTPYGTQPQLSQQAA